MDDCIENDSRSPQFSFAQIVFNWNSWMLLPPKFDFDTSVTSFKQIDVDTKEGIFESAAVAFSEWRRSETIINGSKNHLGASGNHPCWEGSVPLLGGKTIRIFKAPPLLLLNVLICANISVAKVEKSLGSLIPVPTT